MLFVCFWRRRNHWNPTVMEAVIQSVLQDPGVFGSEKNPALVSGERTSVRPVTDWIRQGHVMERQK